MQTTSEARYETMDALRCIGVMAVVLYHIGHRFPAAQFATHGHLAIDFFFIMSGFVLAHGYEGKLGSMSVLRFAQIRLIRLLPLSSLGVLIGTAYLLLRWKVHPELSDSLPEIITTSALNVVFIPKLWIAAATKSELFPADGILWSISLELLMSLIWASGVYRFRTSALAFITAVGAAVAAFCILQNGEPDIGYNWSTYFAGVGRAVFGYFAGVVIWRLRPRFTLSWQTHALTAVALAAMFSLPLESLAYDIIAITMLLPLLIYILSSTELYSDFPSVRFFADLSYPLYMIHLPILMFLSGWVKETGSNSAQASLLAFASIPLVVALCWYAGRAYDVPVRRWLAGSLLIEEA
jgi:peptidoglycan/LPS O-acetylase OafA/YrhL